MTIGNTALQENCASPEQFLCKECDFKATFKRDRLNMGMKGEKDNNYYQLFNFRNAVHNKNVCHRDLKLETILLMKKTPKSLVKITDFGF